MNAHFDIAATNYDATFTNSTIGRMQRQRVWQYLEKELPQKPLRILELNCGTGEDALFLAQQGHHVVASDIAPKMVQITQQKVKQANLEALVKVQCLDIKSIKRGAFTDKFDLVFSNFGGLNCLNDSDLKALAEPVANLLTSQGRLIAVVMPPYNWMESVYYILKLEWTKMFRRKSSKLDGVLVNVDGIDVPTWYYSPRHFEQKFHSDFVLKAVKSIGFLPSYFENLVHRFPFLLKIDCFLSRYGAFANIGDHYLIELEKNR